MDKKIYNIGINITLIIKKETNNLSESISMNREQIENILVTTKGRDKIKVTVIDTFLSIFSILDNLKIMKGNRQLQNERITEYMVMPKTK